MLPYSQRLSFYSNVIVLMFHNTYVLVTSCSIIPRSSLSWKNLFQRLCKRADIHMKHGIKLIVYVKSLYTLETCCIWAA